MGGVFMKKTIKLCTSVLLLICLFLLGGVVAQKERLQENLIRLHVVADSDSPEDQSLKLLVRDAVTQHLRPILADTDSVEEAKAVLSNALPELQQLAETVLHSHACTDAVQISLRREAFDTRHYDTFSLPAGVYESLRIQIGTGQGKNWWCVVFPSLCLPATTDGFTDSAVSAGFDSNTAKTLTGEAHEIRFFLLDCFGKIENFFYTDEN